MNTFSSVCDEVSGDDNDDDYDDIVLYRECIVIIAVVGI